MGGTLNVASLYLLREEEIGSHPLRVLLAYTFDNARKAARYNSYSALDAHLLAFYWSRGGGGGRGGVFVEHVNGIIKCHFYRSAVLMCTQRLLLSFFLRLSNKSANKNNNFFFTIHMISTCEFLH